jgi:hypothetical protein
MSRIPEYIYSALTGRARSAGHALMAAYMDDLPLTPRELDLLFISEEEYEMVSKVYAMRRSQIYSLAELRISCDGLASRPEWAGRKLQLGWAGPRSRIELAPRDKIVFVSPKDVQLRPGANPEHVAILSAYVDQACLLFDHYTAVSRFITGAMSMLSSGSALKLAMPNVLAAVGDSKPFSMYLPRFDAARGRLPACWVRDGWAEAEEFAASFIAKGMLLGDEGRCLDWRYMPRAFVYETAYVKLPFLPDPVPLETIP